MSSNQRIIVSLFLFIAFPFLLFAQKTITESQSWVDPEFRRFYEKVSEYDALDRLVAYRNLYFPQYYSGDQLDTIVENGVVIYNELGDGITVIEDYRIDSMGVQNLFETHHEKIDASGRLLYRIRIAEPETGIYLDYTADGCPTSIIQSRSSSSIIVWDTISIEYANGCTEQWKNYEEFVPNVFSHTRNPIKVIRTITDTSLYSVFVNRFDTSNIERVDEVYDDQDRLIARYNLGSDLQRNKVNFFEYDQFGNLTLNTRLQRQAQDGPLINDEKYVYYHDSYVDGFPMRTRERTEWWDGSSWLSNDGKNDRSYSRYCDGTIRGIFGYIFSSMYYDDSYEYKYEISPAPECEAYEESAKEIRSSELEAFPNPTTGFVTFSSEIMQLPGAQIKVFSTDGRCLYKEQINCLSKVLNLDAFGHNLVYVVVIAEKAVQGTWVKVD